MKISVVPLPFILSNLKKLSKFLSSKMKCQFQLLYSIFKKLMINKIAIQSILSTGKYFLYTCGNVRDKNNTSLISHVYKCVFSNIINLAVYY
jgi:hypothetical protein